MPKIDPKHKLGRGQRRNRRPVNEQQPRVVQIQHDATLVDFPRFTVRRVGNLRGETFWRVRDEATYSDVFESCSHREAARVANRLTAETVFVVLPETVYASHAKLRFSYDDNTQFTNLGKAHADLWQAAMKVR